jgi:hypothetical protein
MHKNEAQWRSGWEADDDGHGGLGQGRNTKTQTKTKTKNTFLGLHEEHGSIHNKLHEEDGVREWHDSRSSFSTGRNACGFKERRQKSLRGNSLINY